MRARKTTAIYGLYHPCIYRLIWYVGKGTAARAQYHWKRFLKNGTASNAVLLAWFRKLKKEGLKPSWRFLQINVSPKKWEQAERNWIKRCRKLNSNLCNLTKGGNAGSSIAGIIGGRRTYELHPNQSRDNGRRTMRLYPKIARIGAKALHKKRRIDKELDRRFRAGARKGGSIGGRRWSHTRWHVSRGIKNPKCSLCRGGSR